jgi:hypothetical protein
LDGDERIEEGLLGVWAEFGGNFTACTSDERVVVEG